MSMDQNKDDADFAAFLRGEGELAEGLDALAQPSPSAALDSAILARARADVERDARNARLQADAQRAREANEARGQAANDAARRSKWGLPGGIAATVLAGVLGHQVWNHNADMERAAKAPAPVAEQSEAQPAPVIAAAPVPDVEKAPAQPAAAREAPSPAKRSVAVEHASAQVAAVRPAPAAPPPPPAPVVDKVADEAAQAAVSPDMYRTAPKEPSRAAGAANGAPLTYSAPVVERAPAQAFSRAPVPPPAPAPAVAVDAAPVASQRVEITGSSVAGSARRTRLPAVDADAWLKRISSLLASGDKERALLEWRNFRVANPDYPVPEPLASAIKAAQE